jgi:ATP-binding cassette subfamily A (ABC1) protein 3
MSIYSYWIGNFIFDYTLYVIVAIFGAGMCEAFGISSLTSGDANTATWILFIIYGFANIPFTYIVSFVFSDYGNAQAGFYFFNFVAGGILSVVILLLRFIGSATSSIGRGIAWPLRFIPAYSFGEGLIN